MVVAPSFIDAHCHLEQETYGDQLAEVIARGMAAGLSHFVAVGASRVAEGAHEALALCARYPNIVAAVGIHPHDAAAADDASCQTIAQCLQHPKVVALGEVGLDYFYEQSPKDVQKRVFARFIRMARAANKPLMLHIRDAHQDAWDLLDAEGLPEAGGMVHCFTAGIEQAEQYLKRGMYLSIPGVVTFKNAGPLREALPHIPLDRMLLETDSPYLAPVPYRGKRNEPGFLPATAQFIAEALDIPLGDLAAQCHANTRRFYKLDAVCP